MMILYCAADLIWATRIKSTADSLGIPCRPARTVDMLEARLADSDVRAFIVDLDAGEPALAMIRTLRALPRPSGQGSDRAITIVAFGPHVATDKFEQARAAGANRVMARGAFDKQLPQLLTELGAPPPT